MTIRRTTSLSDTHTRARAHTHRKCFYAIYTRNAQKSFPNTCISYRRSLAVESDRAFQSAATPRAPNARSFITVTPVGCTLYCRIFVFYPFVKEFSPPLLNVFIRRARRMQRGNEVTRDRCRRYSVIYDTRNK